MQASIGSSLTREQIDRALRDARLGDASAVLDSLGSGEVTSSSFSSSETEDIRKVLGNPRSSEQERRAAINEILSRGDRSGAVSSSSTRSTSSKSVVSETHTGTTSTSSDGSVARTVSSEFDESDGKKVKCEFALCAVDSTETVDGERATVRTINAVFRRGDRADCLAKANDSEAFRTQVLDTTDQDFSAVVRSCSSFLSS